MICRLEQDIKKAKQNPHGFNLEAALRKSLSISPPSDQMAKTVIWHINQNSQAGAHRSWQALTTRKERHLNQGRDHAVDSAVGL